MKTRSGEDRRKQPREDLPKDEIAHRRTSIFQWATLLLPNAPILLKIVLLLGLGAGTAVTAPKVYKALNGDNVVDPVEGNIHAPTTEDMDTQQNRAINEIIEKLKEQDQAILDAKKFGRGDDAAQNSRLDALEELVQ